ncbi:hypothetical protein C8C87_0509 [Flavobacterium sp. 120]|nr:hypothetical protein C8C87_0509 [Flavobacterium sp. 120]
MKFLSERSPYICNHSIINRPSHSLCLWYYKNIMGFDCQMNKSEFYLKRVTRKSIPALMALFVFNYFNLYISVVWSLINDNSKISFSNYINDQFGFCSWSINSFYSQIQNI